MTVSQEELTEIEEYFPINGPCLMCGTPGFSARHRVLDAIRDLLRAGESVYGVAEDYDVPERVVESIKNLNNHQYGRLRRMPIKDWEREVQEFEDRIVHG